MTPIIFFIDSEREKSITIMDLRCIAPKIFFIDSDRECFQQTLIKDSFIPNAESLTSQRSENQKFCNNNFCDRYGTVIIIPVSNVPQTPRRIDFKHSTIQQRN
jgi:hypothetical protein